MLTTVKGIVLNHVNYSDTSVITNVYTDLFGRIAVMINGIRGRKSRFSMNMIQALAGVEMEIYYRQNRNIHRVKELCNYMQYQTIPYEINKGTQAIFVAEILHRALREEEMNRQLYEFLEHSIQIFDLQEKNTNNFHLVFLIRLSKYLGFFPQDNYSADACLFDLRNGYFTSFPPTHPDHLEPSLSEGLHRLLAVSMKETESFEMGFNIRTELTKALSDYYRLHIQDFGKVKSIEILREVLR